MLESTDFSLHAARLLFSAASGYFLLSFVLATLYFLRFRERFAARHMAFCLSLLLYTLGSLAFTYGPFSSNITRLIMTIIFIAGPTIFVIYADMVVQILHTKPKWLPYLLVPLRVFSIAFVIDFFVWLGSGSSLFMTNVPDPGVQNWYTKTIAESLTIEPATSFLLIPCFFSLLIISVFLLVDYRETLKKEFLLRLGIILTFISQIHDMAMLVFDPYILFPLAFMGYLFEVVRFNISLVEGYVRHNDRMSTRLKDSLMSFAQVRLSKQILHDVKSVRRNLLYKLEHSKEFSHLPEEIKREIDRLEVYNNGELKLPKERISLHEICHTTAYLFDKEFREAGLDLKFSVPEDLFIYATRSDILIVLINLIQNSLDALAGKSRIWMRFEGAAENDRVILRVSDSGKISADMIAQIFKPGYSSKGSTRGLGLNIVQEALAANCGLISLCEESENTVFKIEFFKPD